MCSVFAPVLSFIIRIILNSAVQSGANKQQSKANKNQVI
jgi:hypothetical protein